MINEKVYVEGYVVGFIVDLTGNRENKIQFSSGDIVDIEECFIHKSIAPEKVKVPQFIDEKIKYCKATDGYGLFHAMDYCYNFKECADWLESNEEIFALAWIFGYEVEKEKRYKVKIKGVNEECEYLVFGELSNTWKFRALNEFGELKKHHTRKELEEANFGWVFDCPGVEIEEVEE